MKPIKPFEMFLCKHYHQHQREQQIFQQTQHRRQRPINTVEKTKTNFESYPLIHYHRITSQDSDPIMFAFGIEVMINRDSRGRNPHQRHHTQNPFQTLPLKPISITPNQKLATTLNNAMVVTGFIKQQISLLRTNQS